MLGAWWAIYNLYTHRHTHTHTHRERERERERDRRWATPTIDKKIQFIMISMIRIFV